MISDQVTEVRPGDEVGDNPGPRPIYVSIPDTGCIRPANPPSRLYFLPEPGPEYVVVGQIGPDQLDRHHLMIMRSCQVDGAHAPGPDAPYNPIRANFLRVTRKQVSNH